MTTAEPHGSCPTPQQPAAALRNELLARIGRFDFNAACGTERFVDVLARENGWERGFAARVVDEYRRLAYLAQLGEGEVFPSDEIDQAWRLHLASSRDYWGPWCGETLGAAWHRTPCGLLRDAEARARYEATLRLYEREFGEPPPIDIWPPASIRFAFEGRFARVNLALFEIRPRAARYGSANPLAMPLALSLLALTYISFLVVNWQNFGGSPLARWVDALVVSAFQTALAALAASFALVVLPRVFEWMKRALGAPASDEPLFEQRQHGRRVIFAARGASAAALPASKPAEAAPIARAVPAGDEQTVPVPAPFEKALAMAPAPDMPEHAASDDRESTDARRENAG
jgi:hypothetical protein